MLWIIVLGIIGFVLFKFFGALNKDNHELEHQALNEKFQFIVDTLNAVAFNGKGKVYKLDKRSFNLYEDGKNQIINFSYGTGILTIIWKYKFFQKEVVHEKTFSNVRNISLFEQQRIAESMAKEMAVIVENHQYLVMNEI